MTNRPSENRRWSSPPASIRTDAAEPLLGFIAIAAPDGPEADASQAARGQIERAQSLLTTLGAHPIQSNKRFQIEIVSPYRHRESALAQRVGRGSLSPG